MSNLNIQKIKDQLSDPFEIENIAHEFVALRIIIRKLIECIEMKELDKDVKEAQGHITQIEKGDDPLVMSELEKRFIDCFRGFTLVEKDFLIDFMDKYKKAHRECMYSIKRVLDDVDMQNFIRRFDELHDEDVRIVESLMISLIGRYD